MLGQQGTNPMTTQLLNQGTLKSCLKSKLWKAGFGNGGTNDFLYFADGVPNGATEAMLTGILCVSHQLCGAIANQNNILHEMAVGIKRLTERLDVRPSMCGIFCA